MYSSFALQWREALHPLNSCAVSFGVGVEGVASLRVGDLDFDGETALKSRRLAAFGVCGFIQWVPAEVSFRRCFISE